VLTGLSAGQVIYLQYVSGTVNTQASGATSCGPAGVATTGVTPYPAVRRVVWPSPAVSQSGERSTLPAQTIGGLAPRSSKGIQSRGAILTGQRALRDRLLFQNRVMRDGPKIGRNYRVAGPTDRDASGQFLSRLLQVLCVRAPGAPGPEVTRRSSNHALDAVTQTSMREKRRSRNARRW
jgi:hypothetical protein